MKYGASMQNLFHCCTQFKCHLPKDFFNQWIQLSVIIGNPLLKESKKYGRSKMNLRTFTDKLIWVWTYFFSIAYTYRNAHIMCIAGQREHLASRTPAQINKKCSVSIRARTEEDITVLNWIRFRCFRKLFYTNYTWLCF